MLAPSVSTNFPVDEWLTQILNHRFCIAVRRLLCMLHVLRIARLALEGDGDTLLRSTGWWLRPVILTCYPARFIPRAHWNWSNLKTQTDFVLFACSLDLKMKERAEAAHPTNTPWFMSSKEPVSMFDMAVFCHWHPTVERPFPRESWVVFRSRLPASQGTTAAKHYWQHVHKAHAMKPQRCRNCQWLPLSRPWMRVKLDA